MSSTIARSILRKFSAWRSSLDEKVMALILVTPSTRWATSRAERLLEPLGRRQGVFDHVVKEAGGDGHHVHLHVGEDGGHLERVDEVGLARMADLPLVLEGREDVGPAQQLEVGVRIVGPDLFEQVFETDHGVAVSNLCGSVHGPHHRSAHRGGQVFGRERPSSLDLAILRSLYWRDHLGPGVGAKGAVSLTRINLSSRSSIQDRRRPLSRGAGGKGDAMQRRFKAAALIVVLAAFSSTLVGCSQLGVLKARKAFKEANVLYAAAGLQEGGGTVRGSGRQRSDPQHRVFLPGQQLRPALQAQPEGRGAERRVPEEGDRELPEMRGHGEGPAPPEAVARVPGQRLRARQDGRPRRRRCRSSRR